MSSQAGPSEPSRTPRPRPRPAVVDEVYAIYEDDRVSPRTVDQPTPAPTSAAALRPASAATTPKATARVPVLDGVIGGGVAPERIREAIILSEVLAPPVARRGGLCRLRPARPTEGRRGEE